MKTKFLMGVVAALAVGTAAQATEYVTNGGFESSSYTSNTQFGAGFGGQGVTGWTGLGGNHLQFYFFGGTQNTTNAVNQYGDPKGYFYDSFNAVSPTGGNFVALDGDSDYSGSISQAITGLTVGGAYTLNFDWAAGQLRNRSGDTTESLVVSLDGQTHSTGVVSVPSTTFTGWMHDTMSFTATSANETLTFLSVGTPNGQPPIAALDSVSLTGGVPEPAAWALMLMGFGGVGLMVRRGRRKALAAA